MKLFFSLATSPRALRSFSGSQVGTYPLEVHHRGIHLARFFPPQHIFPGDPLRLRPRAEIIINYIG